MRSRVYLLGGAGNETPLMFQSVAVSILCHLVFFTALILIPSRTPDRKFLPSVINVRMVTLPPLGTAAGTTSPPPFTRDRVPVIKKSKARKTADPEQHLKEVIIPPKPDVAVAIQDKPEVQPEKPKEIPDAKIAPKPDAPVENKPAPEVSVAPKTKLKTSLKKKTFSSAKAVKHAIATIEEKSENTRPKQVEEAINRLKRSVGETEPPRSLKNKTGAGASGKENGAPGGSITGNAKALELIDIYRTEISYHINKKWAFNPQLADGRSDLMAVLVIKIMPDGEIREIWFEKKSGNAHFDDSAFRAVKKSNPLPQLPKGYLRPFYNLGLIFTPSGLKRGAIR